MSGSLPDLSGQKIGEYEILKRVGIGGMGAVYEGRQPLIGKRVAVKVLLPVVSNEEELVQRFLAEARAVNEIRHRGIVDIFSFGQLPGGAHYFVMEYLEGEPFDRIIKQRAPLPPGEALAWTSEVLDALDAAHQAGIIHRDIKPSNLFLVNTGRGRPYVKLLDFGIAKLDTLQGEQTPQTRASVILGTPDYISPEQARGYAISPQTDLYAVGCVLFEMLTGQRLFKGENTLQTMWSHVEDAPPAPSSLRPELPKELDDAVLWTLAKRPEERPASAAVLRDFLDALRPAFGPSGVTPPPISGNSLPLLSRTPPPSARSRPLAVTRVAPATPHRVPSVTTPAVAVVTEPATAVVPPPESSGPKLVFALAGMVGLLLVAVVAYVVVSRSGETPPVVEPQVEVAKPEPVAKQKPKPEPKPEPEPVAKQEPPPTEPEPIAKQEPPPPEKEPEPKPEPVKPKPGQVITHERLVTRLRKVEAALAAKEAGKGAPDNIMRQFVAQAKKQVQSSTSDAARREAWNFLGDLERQLK